MAIDLDGLVAGEPLRLLLRALAQMDMTPDADGGATITGRLDPEPGAALQRALDRIQEESAGAGVRPGTGGNLSAAGPPSVDGRGAGVQGADEDRTGAGDAADAFTVLLRRIVDAAGA